MSMNSDSPGEEYPLLLPHTTDALPVHRLPNRRAKQWDPTRSTTREVRQLTVEALSAGCIALTVALHLTASHVEVATILQLVVAGVGTVLAVVAMAMRPADLKPPVTLCAAGIFSAVQVALIAYPSSLQRWVESNTVALEIAFYAIDGVAVAFYIHGGLLRRHTKKLWRRFIRSDPWMAPPDAFATVHYTEFGHVLDRVPRSFAHVRETETLTAGRIPGANIGMDPSQVPVYGSRQYEADDSMRRDFDEMVSTRRMRVASTHFAVVQPAGTRDVYIAFKPRARRAVNLVGYEAQGRFESSTLRWLGGKATGANRILPTDHFHIGADTQLREVPEVALGNPIKILDYQALQLEIDAVAATGADPRLALEHRTRALVAIGVAVTSETERNRQGVVAFRVILHNAVRLLRNAPRPAAVPDPPKLVQPSPQMNAKALSKVKLELEELRAEKLVLEAEVTEERSRKENAVLGWQKASAHSEAVENALELVKAKAEAKFRKLKDRNAALATEGANLKQQLHDTTEAVPTANTSIVSPTRASLSPPKTVDVAALSRSVTFVSSTTAVKSDGSDAAATSILSPDRPTTPSRGSSRAKGTTSDQPTRSIVSPTVVPRKRSLNKAAPPGSPSMSQRSRILQHVEAVAKSPKAPRRVVPEVTIE